MTLVTAAAAALSTMGNLLALGWFGMWMGLISRTANLATLKTILFVQVIPWFVIAFCSTMAMALFMAKSVFSGSSTQPTWWLVWWPLVTAVVSTTLALIKELGQEHTILLSTHILAEVETICERVIIIQRGRVSLDKKLAELATDQAIIVVGDCAIHWKRRCLSSTSW